MVCDLRRSLIEQRGLDKAWIDFTGYRKRERVESVEGDAAVVDADNHETPSRSSARRLISASVNF
ncbi:hypothetical protein [Corynebacterium variabile]|uniref:hypothetical protein n=1 Tax=Corynebacterium variabile TaxID=1727 RepID=UPI0028974CDE|nr:hypothetical protein [Corynebacterium variabile]